MACMDNLNYDQYIDRLSQVIMMELIFYDNPRLIPEDPGPQLPDGLEYPALHLPPGFNTAINCELFPLQALKQSSPQLLLRAPDDVTVGEKNNKKSYTNLISRVYQKQIVLEISTGQSRCLNGTQVTLQSWLQAWPMASWYAQTSPVVLKLTHLKIIRCSGTSPRTWRESRRVSVPGIIGERNIVGMLISFDERNNL